MVAVRERESSCYRFLYFGEDDTHIGPAERYLCMVRMVRVHGEDGTRAW